jgi:S-(hydroxymethyl)glutathione dehydrogenase/alcohol dehydrogenase
VRAAVLAELKQPIVVEEIELLDPTPGRVVVRTGATPFCSTDCINQRGELGKVPPTILGHASIGVVEAIGADVTHVRVGDRVLVPGTPECGHCFYCAEGRPDQCSELFDAKAYFHVAFRSDGAPVSAAGNVGGYAEMMNVTANQAFPLHTDLPDDVLSLLGCGITSGVGAVLNVAEVKPGRSVAILGCGHLGLWMVQGARLAGAGRIIAVEPIAWRREMAGELGATDLVDPADGDPVEQVRALTGGRGADYVLEAAGMTAAQEQALTTARRAVARGGDGGPAPPPTRTIALRHLADEPLDAAEHDRERLPVGAIVEGPAVIREALSTTFVMPGQIAEIGSFGEIVIERRA